MVDRDEKNSNVSQVVPKTEVIKDPMRFMLRPLPFPWPILLSVFVLAGTFALEQDFIFAADELSGIRLKWDLLCSVIPGLAIICTIGAFAQIKRRPMLSLLTVILSIVAGYMAYMEIQRLIENRWLV